MPSDWARRWLQFRTLYRVFLLRVVDLELLSADGDPTKLIGQFATIFVTTSLFFTLPALLMLMGTGSLPGTEGWTPEHFFIETAMTCAGLIAVLNWEAAFPDKRDLLVLAPLPVKRSTLVCWPRLLLCSRLRLSRSSHLNIFSGVVWPLLFRSANSGFVGVLRVIPCLLDHYLCGGRFFCIHRSRQYRDWRPICFHVSFSSVCPRFCKHALCALLLSVYFLEPSLESPAALTSPQNHRLLEWLPSYWFLALFNQLNGSMHPTLVPLAKRAWIGLGVSGLGACTALLLCYFRLMRKMVEQPDILPQSCDRLHRGSRIGSSAHRQLSPASACARCCAAGSIA